MTNSAVAIEARQMWQAHSVQWILQDISFQVNPGELAVLTGVNGVGKTTLLETIAGVKSPLRGEVSVNGYARRKTVEAEKAARRSSVYLPSDVYLPAEMTVQEYLEAASSLYCEEEAEAIDRIEALLDLFALTNSQRQQTASLSDGQKKKLVLISVLIADRDVLLLDEPLSGGLDPAGILAVKRLLRRRADRGQTILMTTPVTELVAEVADRLLVLRNSRLVHDLMRDEILASVDEGSTVVESLEELVFPDVHHRVDAFLESMPSVRSSS